MAIAKYRSYWDIYLDNGGGSDVPNDTLITPNTSGFTPPDVVREIITLQSGKYANERILGRLQDMTCTVMLTSNYHQLSQIGKDYEFDVEEELIDNEGGEAKMVTYSVVGKLQSRSLGQSSHDNSPRPITLTLMVLKYIEKHSDQSDDTYQIDLTSNPMVFKQSGVNMFP